MKKIANDRHKISYSIWLAYSYIAPQVKYRVFVAQGSFTLILSMDLSHTQLLKP